jgi:crotonobetainyl-CoA:carnitine CoA-transferase CaiB-like acyl-CoA transferase
MALPPPDYGEHTEEILQEIGLSGEEISKLREEDII